MVRGKPLPARRSSPLPFVPHRYRPQELRPRGRCTWPSSATPRITSGSASTATSPPSASPTTPRSSSATWCSSSVPEVGRKVKQGEAVAVVESVKAASDVYAPVSGEVVEANATLADKPALVNEDAEGKGWFFKLKHRRPGRARRPDGRAAYEAFVKEQLTRCAISRSPMPTAAPCWPRIGVRRHRRAVRRRAERQAARASCSTCRRPQGELRGRARAGPARGAERRRRARCRSSSAPAPTGTTCRRPSIT